MFDFLHNLWVLFLLFFFFVGRRVDAVDFTYWSGWPWFTSGGDDDGGRVDDDPDRAASDSRRGGGFNIWKPLASVIVPRGWRTAAENSVCGFGNNGLPLFFLQGRWWEFRNWIWLGSCGILDVEDQKGKRRETGMLSGRRKSSERWLLDETDIVCPLIPVEYKMMN